MDFSYIEEESVHIRAPYLSSPHLSLNRKSESIDEGEHQISRHFDPWPIEESDCHHHSIPYWKLIPSKNNFKNPQDSRPQTSIISIPLKKHLLEESIFYEEEESDSFSYSQHTQYYGKTGRVLRREFGWDSNFESKVIEEFLLEPFKLAKVLEDCKVYVQSEFNMLSKIIIDLMVEFWKSRENEKFRSWVKIAQNFYSEVEFPIFTNFVLAGILHFETREEYLHYFEILARQM